MSPSESIDKQIAETADWRGPLITNLRRLIHEVDPDIVEEWKWGTGVWNHNGMVCAIAPMKDKVKLNFFKGAQIPDPKKLFINGLESKNQRSIDFSEKDTVHEAAVKDLFKAGIQLNS